MGGGHGFMRFISWGEGPPLLLRQALAERDRPDGRAHYYLFSHNREEF